jgi:transcriptional regulator with XRE-family HTH domain
MRVLDLDQPLDRFANELRELQRSALARGETPEARHELDIDQLAGRHRSSRATIYAALSGRRLPSTHTLLILVAAWTDGDKDARAAAQQEWLTKRAEVERKLALSVPARRAAVRPQPAAAVEEAERERREAERVRAREMLGAALRELIRGHGAPPYRAISWQARAHGYEVSAQRISDITRGKGFPRRDTLDAILHGLRLTPAERNEMLRLYDRLTVRYS